METCFIPSKRKMNTEITENYEANGVIKKTKGNSIRSERFSITEVKGDLFTCSDTHSLAHCVSQDLKMGKGIAIHFKNKFDGVQELQSQNCRIGGIGILKRNGRFIYYLITKERYWHKPTYVTLRSSLQALKSHALENNIINLAMPKIGCGLDGLIWEKVRDVIADVFKDTDIRIIIYYI
ncbi:UNVERIFIED_CONTAM: hypothetical protein RMT77_001640 [Armadillidium vulgare]|uniref:O-acetyl-ADP-ribose deacetylase 1 n=1 Tax=Armadillidium nasatum TaxID=96803 RepID=A0A5N5TEA0_9CRUS|nr:O-acetyl-ADP-ribose deacetylase 1 [Armadillidium nasatum]RXG73362.1 O-acetyl-ADP-ribose deacetylase 1 [Armadillidium vulgare]